MGTKEAMPKAAFQYGMKMSDGRKTKGKIGAKNEKAKLDKEWNKISALISGCQYSKYYFLNKNIFISIQIDFQISLSMGHILVPYQ